MIRATTPTHCFIFEEDPSRYAKILITYAQGNVPILEKTKDDLTIEEITDDVPKKGHYRAYFRLTQEETKRFNNHICTPVMVQIRALTELDEALASEKIKIPIYDVLNDEVLI